MRKRVRDSLENTVQERSDVAESTREYEQHPGEKQNQHEGDKKPSSTACEMAQQGSYRAEAVDDTAHDILESFSLFDEPSDAAILSFLRMITSSIMSASISLL